MLTAWLLEAELRPMRPAECRAAVRIGALGRLREPMISAQCSTILLLEGFAWASRYYSTKGDEIAAAVLFASDGSMGSRVVMS